MLLLLLACGAPLAAISVGDEWAALGDGAPARRARRLLLHGKPALVRSLVEQCEQAQREPMATPPIRSRGGGSRARGLPPNALLEALLQQVDAVAPCTNPHPHPHPYPHPSPLRFPTGGRGGRG
jgi:hypothetical protein